MTEKNIKDPVLETHNLTVRYDKAPVLWDIDLEIPEGNLIGIIGPNGSGKTTLLKSIMNLVDTDSGYIRLFGKPLEEVREKVSYVPQRESVDWDFPASVREVVQMGRYRRSTLFKPLLSKDKRIAEEALEKVGMQDLAGRQIAQLSGGQQQRVFIARALAQEADLYLMDEPFAGIDASTENAIIELLGSMKKEGKTVIIVHHDLQTAIAYFDWIVLLNTRLVGSGPKDSVFTPELLQEAYGGKLNVLSQISERLSGEDFPVREEGLADRKSPQQ